jgi:hypothetical protein
MEEEVFPEGHKRCCKCAVLKPLTDFYHYKRSKDGYYFKCKTCQDNYLKERKGKLKELRKVAYVNGTEVPVKTIDISRQPDTIKRIATCWIEHPTFSISQIGQILGIPAKQIKYYCYFNPYLKAFRELAKKSVSNLIPLAIKGFRECLTSDNERIKLDAATLLLKSERVLGSDKLDVTVSNNDEIIDVKELRKIVQAAKLIPDQTIPDEYLITNGTNGTISH